jgi:hypothetical protein
MRLNPEGTVLIDPASAKFLRYNVEIDVLNAYVRQNRCSTFRRTHGFQFGLFAVRQCLYIFHWREMNGAATLLIFLAVMQQWYWQIH